jgi:4-hydroxybutyryl-CoA dehydratase / vinylacetyl-CoA-Delta-isomerase
VLTAAAYRESLHDGRQVQYAGRMVADVSSEPAFQPAVEWTARGYAEHYDAQPGAVGPYFQIPRSVDQLRSFEARLKGWDMATIATAQGLLMAVTAASRMRDRYPVYAERALAYFEDIGRRDIRCAMAITDAKGNRSLSPGAQPDADHYVRITQTRASGVVIRGAKMHITSAVNGHELIVMPTKRMKPGEEAWAFAGAVPVNAPGVKIVATSVAQDDPDPDRYPYSSAHAVPEAMVIFDDVFVPAERVFLGGEVEHSGTWAHSLGMWERLGNLGHLIDVAHALVGLADLIAEANGLSRFAHVREKIGNMAIYATMLTAALDAAITNADVSPEGYVSPSELFTNAGKFHAAEHFHAVIRDLHDIAGGAVLTAPSIKDLSNPDVGAYVEKYMRTMAGISGEYRMRLFHAIRDLTADAYAGWLTFTILLGGGGLHAQRAVTLKHYDMDTARRLALEVTGVTAC